MIDLEKVIKGVECHRKKVQTTNAVSCLECPYSEPKPKREWCMSGLMDDIYALMKEQEAVKPRVSTVQQRCGNCNKVIEMDGRIACPWCGKPILWEAVGRSVKRE